MSYLWRKYFYFPLHSLKISRFDDKFVNQFKFTSKKENTPKEWPEQIFLCKIYVLYLRVSKNWYNLIKNWLMRYLWSSSQTYTSRIPDVKTLWLCSSFLHLIKCQMQIFHVNMAFSISRIVFFFFPSFFWVIGICAEKSQVQILAMGYHLITVVACGLFWVVVVDLLERVVFKCQCKTESNASNKQKFHESLL